MSTPTVSRAFAAAPPEHRGVPRDGVRLLVARTPGDLQHRPFRALPYELEPGDLVLVATSATITCSFIPIPHQAAARLSSPHGLALCSNLRANRPPHPIPLHKR